MKLSTKFAFAAFALALSATADAHASLIVADGDFSNPSGGADHVTYFSGSSVTMAPWTVTSGDVDLIGGLWQSPSVGGGSVDLDGFDPGSISQTLTNLNPGNYVLSFAFSANPEGGLATKSMQVSVGNVVNDPFSYTLTSANSDTNMLYQTVSVPFSIIGTGPQSTNLSFASTDVPDANGISYYGPVIGNVAVSAVPLPNSLPLFGAALLGMCAYGLTRRRQVV